MSLQIFHTVKTPWKFMSQLYLKGIERNFFFIVWGPISTLTNLNGSFGFHFDSIIVNGILCQCLHGEWDWASWVKFIHAQREPAQKLMYCLNPLSYGLSGIWVGAWTLGRSFAQGWIAPLSISEFQSTFYAIWRFECNVISTREIKLKRKVTSGDT